MEYRRVSIYYTENRERFYRVLDIRNDLNLVHAGVIFATALCCEFEHHFMFREKGRAYVPEAFLGNGSPSWRPMKEYRLKDLEEDFRFEYDSAEGWEFDCETISVFEKDDLVFAYLVDGKGQGIWEDCKTSLDLYLEGRISGEASYEDLDEDSGMSLPWNFENDCFEDFDDYDLQGERDCFEDFYLSDINEYVRGCHVRGYEKEVPCVDLESYFAGESPFVEDLYENDEAMFAGEDDMDYDDETDFLAESFVNMQIGSYCLVRDLLEHFRLMHPEMDEEELLEIIRDVLMEDAYRELDDLIDEEGSEEEYH